MNNNKTVSQPATGAVVSSTSITTDSTAPNSSITTTNSDQESSVSTLSPATTPSMDYGQIDGMDFNTPLYYPSYYYDENGILVIRKCSSTFNFNKISRNFNFLLQIQQQCIMDITIIQIHHQQLLLFI